MPGNPQITGCHLFLDMLYLNPAISDFLTLGKMSCKKSRIKNQGENIVAISFPIGS